MSSPTNRGLHFGRYEALFRIAAGGMAEVYAARLSGEGGFEKPVALKRMLPGLAADAKFVQMFLDEGRVAANISSPHVVQTLDLGRAEDGSLYLVMELVVGAPLGSLLRATVERRELFSAPVAAEIFLQAATGLHDAHDARNMYGEPLGIIHRDVSPQNILLDVAGRVRLTDFGVARAIERVTQTQFGEMKGKVGYFAPEQLLGGAVDRRTDVFAMGIVAWETLAGERLFFAEQPAQAIDKVLRRPIPGIEQRRSDVPPALAAAIARALERDPARRFASAGEFVQAIRQSLAPAGPPALAALVRQYGGEHVRAIEEGLRSSTRNPGSMRPPSGPVQTQRPQASMRPPSGPVQTQRPQAAMRPPRHEPEADLVDLDDEPTAYLRPGVAGGLSGVPDLSEPMDEKPTTFDVPGAIPPTVAHAMPASATQAIPLSKAKSKAPPAGPSRESRTSLAPPPMSPKTWLVFGGLLVLGGIGAVLALGEPDPDHAAESPDPVIDPPDAAEPASPDAWRARVEVPPRPVESPPPVAPTPPPQATVEEPPPEPTPAARRPSQPRRSPSAPTAPEATSAPTAPEATSAPEPVTEPVAPRTPPVRRRSASSMAGLAGADDFEAELQ